MRVTLLDHLHGPAADSLRLDYEARLVRRKRLVTEGGRAVMLDLPQVTDLTGFAGMRLEDGTEVALVPAAEPVLVIRGDLVRLAWHIGNRHTPCQFAGDALVIRQDPVLRDMVERLGGQVTPDLRPFHPEGGAYGHGRTMGHSHGPEDGHGHGHVSGHGHGHGHEHPHGHDHRDAAGSDHAHGHGQDTARIPPQDAVPARDPGPGGPTDAARAAARTDP